MRAGRIEGADRVTGTSAGQRVLVVDDVDEMRTIAQRALRARGYQVDVAGTLADAIGMDPGGYDAVLIDSPSRLRAGHRAHRSAAVSGPGRGQAVHRDDRRLGGRGP